MLGKSVWWSMVAAKLLHAACLQGGCKADGTRTPWLLPPRRSSKNKSAGQPTLTGHSPVSLLVIFTISSRRQIMAEPFLLTEALLLLLNSSNNSILTFNNRFFLVVVTGSHTRSFLPLSLIPYPPDRTPYRPPHTHTHTLVSFLVLHSSLAHSLTHSVLLVFVLALLFLYSYLAHQYATCCYCSLSHNDLFCAAVMVWFLW